MVTMLGPSFLVETIEDVLKAIEVLVAGKVGTHGLVDAQSKAQETYRMQHEVIEGVDAANAHPIATSAMELLASIVRVMGANPSFLPAYQLPYAVECAGRPDELLHSRGVALRDVRARCGVCGLRDSADASGDGKLPQRVHARQHLLPDQLALRRVPAGDGGTLDGVLRRSAHGTGGLRR